MPPPNLKAIAPAPPPELPKCPQGFVLTAFDDDAPLPDFYAWAPKAWPNEWHKCRASGHHAAPGSYIYATPLADAGAKEKCDSERKGLDRELHADPVQREASKMLGVIMSRYELRWIPTDDDAEDFIGIATRFLRDAEMRGRKQVEASEEALNDMELGPSIQKPSRPSTDFLPHNPENVPVEKLPTRQHREETDEMVVSSEEPARFLLVGELESPPEDVYCYVFGKF